MNQQTRFPMMKRPRLYQSFLVALVPTLLLSLVQVSRLTSLPAYHDDSAVSQIPLASSRSSNSRNRVEMKKGSLGDASLAVQDEASDGRRLAVVSFVDSMDYYLWGIYSIHKQLKKVEMTPHIRHVALVASDMKSKHLRLIESWLGKDNVWPVNKSILRKKVPKGNKLWGAVFSKLEFFNLTMFDKVIALDNDILIRRNIEHWFDLPAPAATQERGSIEWNSGAMVIEPSEQLFNTLLDYLSKTKLWRPSVDDGIDPWNSGDGHQGFLSAFFTSDVTPQSMFTMNYGCSVLSSDLEAKFENHYYWMYRNQAIETMHLTKHKPWKEKTESSKPATCAMLREWGESVKDAPLDKMPPLPNYLRKCPPIEGEEVITEEDLDVEILSEGNEDALDAAVVQ